MHLQTTLGENHEADIFIWQKPGHSYFASGKIMGSRLVHRVAANYPAEARAKGIEGTVALEIIVGANGAVEQIEVLSGPSILAKAAMDAVRQWKYDPTYIKGEAVKVVTRVDVSFRLHS
jgi:periplasmic protein TonB